MENKGHRFIGDIQDQALYGETFVEATAFVIWFKDGIQGELSGVYGWVRTPKDYIFVDEEGMCAIHPTDSIYRVTRGNVIKKGGPIDESLNKTLEVAHANIPEAHKQQNLKESIHLSSNYQARALPDGKVHVFATDDAGEAILVVDRDEEGKVLKTLSELCTLANQGEAANRLQAASKVVEDEAQVTFRIIDLEEEPTIVMDSEEFQAQQMAGVYEATMIPVIRNKAGQDMRFEFREGGKKVAIYKALLKISTADKDFSQNPVPFKVGSETLAKNNRDYRGGGLPVERTVPKGGE